MADFSALKQSIQNYIKQNGNKEITGAILHNILLSMVTTMGDGAINDNASDISDIKGDIQNINGDITNINSAITTRLNTGALYAGYATPSTTPATLTSQKVFYLATQAGTYTHFHFNGGNDPIILAKDGIYFIVSGNDADDWNAEIFLQLDDILTDNSNNPVKGSVITKSINLTRADNYREKETIPFTKTDGKYFKVNGTEESNANFCIIKVDFPSPYYDNYYFDNVYAYGTDPANLGYIRYKDANDNVIKTIANSIRSGFIGYRVEKINGAASYEICGPKANWGDNFNVYKGNISIIPSKLSAIDQEFNKLKSDFAPQYAIIKETLNYSVENGKYFNPSGADVSNGNFSILTINFPSTYYDNYYIDSDSYGSVGLIRYLDSSNNVIKTITTNVRGGIKGYRVEKISGATKFQICGTTSLIGNGVEIYSGVVSSAATFEDISAINQNISAINQNISAINQEFDKLESDFAPQYALTKETLNYTVENGKYFNPSGVEVSNGNFSILTMEFPSSYYDNYYIDSSAYGSLGLIRYLDANNNVIKTITTNVRGGVKGYRVEKITNAAKFQICGATNSIGNGVEIYSGVVSSAITFEEVSAEADAGFERGIIKPENAQLSFFNSVSEIEQTVENGKYFNDLGADVTHASFSIITVEFPQNYYDEYYIDAQSYGHVGFLRYLDSSNNVIKTLASNVRGGVKGYRVKKIDNAAKFQICGATNSIGNGTRVYSGTRINKTEELGGSIQRKKYLGKKLFAIGDSHTQNRSRWLPYVLDKLGCIGDEAAQQAVYNAGATMENPLYYDYLLQHASKLIEISQGGGFTPDIILIEQCHYNNVTDPIDAVSNTVVLPEKLLRIDQTFNSKSAAIAYWNNNYSTILSGFSTEAHKRTMLEIPYGALGRNLVFEATKTITAGRVKLSIDGTEFTTQVTAGMSIEQVVNAMSIWKYGDTTDWSNGDEVDSDTLHLTYNGQEEHPSVSIIFTDVDNCGVSLVSNTEVGRIWYLLRYFYPSTTTDWLDETKWLHLNDSNDSLGYGFVKGCIEMLQKGFPNAKIIIWSVQGLILTHNSYVTNGCFDNQAFLNDPNYKKFEVDARTVMFGVAKQYALKTIDVAGMCGITPLNMFEGNFYNENDLHPKPAGYQRWAETLVENI